MPLVKVQSRGTENVGGATKNFLINGGFTVSQRNGSTLTATANNSYFLDRWLLYLNGSCAVSTQQMLSADSNVTALNTATGETFNNVLSIDCTTGASLGSTDLLGFLQLIEGSNSVPLAGQSCTLSFHVKSNVTGQYYVAFKIGSSRTYLVGYTISSADTWEKKTITFVNDTLANLNSYASVTTSAGLQVYFGLRLGTSGQMSNTLNAWHSGNYYGKSDQVTWGTSASDSFYIGGVQLELGSQASNFEHEDINTALSKCQRYFCQMFNNENGNRYIGILQPYSTSAVYGHILDYPATMRALPSVTQSGDFNVLAKNSAIGISNGAIPSFSGNIVGWRTGGWTGGSNFTQGGGAVIQAVSNSKLKADAELTTQ